MQWRFLQIAILGLKESAEKIKSRFFAAVLSAICCDGHVPFVFMQDKRAHLNDHIEASVEEHLELTWSSLAATKQELDNMKDLQQTLHQMQEANQKLTESMADSREEVQNLTLAMKNLEMRNIQQRKWMEDMVRKMAKEMKSLENKMVEVKASHNDEETCIRRAYLSFPTSENRQRRSIVREIPNGRSCVQMSYPSKRDIDAELLVRPRTIATENAKT